MHVGAFSPKEKFDKESAINGGSCVVSVGKSDIVQELVV